MQSWYPLISGINFGTDNVFQMQINADIWYPVLSRSNLDPQDFSMNLKCIRNPYEVVSDFLVPVPVLRSIRFLGVGPVELGRSGTYLGTLVGTLKGH